MFLQILPLGMNVFSYNATHIGQLLRATDHTAVDKNMVNKQLFLKLRSGLLVLKKNTVFYTAIFPELVWAHYKQ